MMAKSLIFATAVLISGSAASAAPWVDDVGRSLQMSFPGAPVIALSANGHDLDNAVSMFSKLCLETNYDKQVAGEIAETTGWGFAYQEEIVPFKNPVDIGGWIAPDADFRIADTIFFNKQSQCNLTVAIDGALDSSQIQSVISGQLMSEPSNIKKAFKKNGQPKKDYQPEWQVLAEDGSSHIVYARQSIGHSNAIHLAVVKQKTKKRRK